MTVISDWIRSAESRRGDAAYLEDARGPAVLSYAGLARAARGWAHALDRAEVPPGVGVAIRLADPVGYATALVAVLAAGRVAVPLDPAAPAARLDRVLRVARPAAAVCDTPDGLPPGLPVLRPPGPGLPPGAGPVAPGLGPAAGGGIFLCTSGTTGTPKGILLTEAQLGHVASGVAGHHRLTAADRGYCPLPLFHVNAEVVGLLGTLRAAATLVLDRTFSRRGFWPLMAGRQITWINAVPAIITVLALDPPVLAPDVAASPPPGVRFVRSASAPLPPSVLAKFEAAFGLPIVETYGMTEAASMITANPLDGPRKPGSAGLPAGTELRIARLDRPGYEPCPAFETGRVQIRGRGVITRYSAGGRQGAIDRDGWLDTGDLGHLDQDGYLFLAGRTDDVINRGGEKIYPREIEDFLLAQPGVRAAVVVAAPDPVLGACPVAWVVPADAGPDLSDPGRDLPDPGPDLADALRAACDRDLPRPLRPRAVRLLAELPLGPTGKPDRTRLQHAAAHDDEDFGLLAHTKVFAITPGHWRNGRPAREARR